MEGQLPSFHQKRGRNCGLFSCHSFGAQASSRAYAVQTATETVALQSSAERPVLWLSGLMLVERRFFIYFDLLAHPHLHFMSETIVT